MRVCGSKVGNFGGIFGILWEFFLEFMLFSTLEGDGAAEGRNVREGGKIWSGGLHEGVGLPSGAHQWRRGRLRFSFFFRQFLTPEKGQNTVILEPTDFFSAAHACRGVNEKKKKKRISTQKTPKISRKLSPTASNTVNGPCNHKDLYLWHRGSRLTR